jgi:acyl-CoA thioester hydrolase
MSFKVSFPTRWADFDPNNHMRHSAYNDYAAESRVRLFNQYGLPLTEFNKLNIGPVLFKEETIFLKEIALSDDIVVEVFLKGVSEKGERFKFHHKIFRGDGKLAAEINIYAAWLDLKTRKLCDPPQMVIDVLTQLEKSDNFEIIPIKGK